MGINDEAYLDRPEQWDELAGRLRRAGIFGLDTEFYGLDVRKESCVGRARVHVWSVAIRTKRMDPLGFRRCRGWVLPAAALLHPALRGVLEDPTVAKAVHNQPVDDHAIHNHGVQLRGCVNTLDLARWVWPDLVTGGGFGLKNLMVVKLHRNPVCEYVDVVADERPVLTSRWKKVNRTECSCGEMACRLRRDHRKTRTEELVEVVTERVEKFQHPLESIVPGHPRWELLVRYAGEDAVAALELEDLARDELNPAEWPYGGRRPGYSQGVADQVVLMEREGFPVDVAYAEEKELVAAADEERELTWLHRWYVANAPTEGPHRRAEVDPIWSSPTQKAALFDELGWPRSPVWAKGKVKRGEVKMDGAAMTWIGKNHPPAKQLLDHLLHLQRVRSGMKYLAAMQESGGHIHPVCGPMGDGDSRNGAVTGRLAVKGQLPAQQLPGRDEVDLYQIRKGIVADTTGG